MIGYAGGECSGALVIKAGAIDQCLINRKSKEAWLFISWLRMISDGPGLDETESESRKRFECNSILIEPCRKPDGISECQSKAPQLSKRVAFEAIT